MKSGELQPKKNKKGDGLSLSKSKRKRKINQKPWTQKNNFKLKGINPKKQILKVQYRNM
jgi:hypothetical protein